MEDILGIEWFENHFLQHCGVRSPQFLILDSHNSHETLSLIEAAKKNSIQLLALLPHTIQWLNPLDKTLFDPFQREYNKVCPELMAKTPYNIVCKWKWPRLYCITP